MAKKIIGQLCIKSLIIISEMNAWMSADENEINASVLEIPHLYLMDVYRNLFDDGFLTGTNVTGDMSGDVYIENLSLVRITTKGIGYLGGQF